ERARDVVEERAFDRDDVDDVRADHAGAEAVRKPQCKLEGTVRMLRSVESDEDVPDHLARPLARYRVDGKTSRNAIDRLVRVGVQAPAASDMSGRGHGSA